MTELTFDTETGTVIMELVPLVILLVVLALRLDPFSTEISRLVYGNVTFGTGTVTSNTGTRTFGTGIMT